jgi:hypothetical protein
MEENKAKSIYETYSHSINMNFKDKKTGELVKLEILDVFCNTEINDWDLKFSCLHIDKNGLETTRKISYSNFNCFAESTNPVF